MGCENIILCRATEFPRDTFFKLGLSTTQFLYMDT